MVGTSWCVHWLLSGGVVTGSESNWALANRKHVGSTRNVRGMECKLLVPEPSTTKLSKSSTVRWWWRYVVNMGVSCSSPLVPTRWTNLDTVPRGTGGTRSLSQKILSFSLPELWVLTSSLLVQRALAAGAARRTSFYKYDRFSSIMGPVIPFIRHTGGLIGVFSLSMAGLWLLILTSQDLTTCR